MRARACYGRAPLLACIAIKNSNSNFGDWASKPGGEQFISGKKPAYGGVLVDSEQRILLREPKGHYDGYVWTFPKGRPDVDESPEEAALREVREETGYAATAQENKPQSLLLDGQQRMTSQVALRSRAI